MEWVDEAEYIIKAQFLLNSLIAFDINLDFITEITIPHPDSPFSGVSAVVPLTPHEGKFFFWWHIVTIGRKRKYTLPN